MDAYSPIATIMQKHGAQCTVEEFHSAVNVTFHRFESNSYDEMHQDMWESLPPQFSLLAADCLRLAPGLPDRLSVLDIGCGTGLASDSLLKSPIGPRIAGIDLLDTSAAMLAQVSRRAAGWSVPTEKFEGIVDTMLPTGRTYDLIVTCSVLHHIPDLPLFLRNVRRLQKPGGVFIHIQDPNGDHLGDPDLKARTAQASQKAAPEWLARLSPARVLGRLSRELNGTQNTDYLAQTNKSLLESGVIKTPLAVEEIFAITDIHANQVSEGKGGISIEALKAWMPDYDLLSTRAYGFFGCLWASLPANLKTVEEELIAKQALSGLHVGALWHLR